MIMLPPTNGLVSYGRMVSLTPLKTRSTKPVSLAAGQPSTSESSVAEPRAEVAVEAAPPSKGWSVKHISGKDSAMNAEYREKHDEKESKLRASRAAREDEKAGRGTVGDTPEEAAKAAAAAEAAAAVSSALAVATAEASKLGSGKERKKLKEQKEHKEQKKSGGKHPSWTDTEESVETSIGIAGSHTEMIQVRRSIYLLQPIHVDPTRLTRSRNAWKLGRQSQAQARKSWVAPYLAPLAQPAHSGKYCGLNPCVLGHSHPKHSMDFS